MTPYAPTDPSKAQILYSPLQRAYTSIGIVSANHYKPGWPAGAQTGAEAVIGRADRSNNDRHVVVEGEAIKFGDGHPLQEMRQ